jgi:dTDP-4-amino-4,6-dideoxygalactose transaminase
MAHVGERQDSPVVAPLRVPGLDLGREYQAIEPLILEAVQSVLASQAFILGPAVTEFERLAAEKCGVAHAIGCSSGTDALWLALEGAGIGAGDAVLTTPFSFFASVSAILRAGAQPVLADIDPQTFQLDPDSVQRNWRREIRAILPVHLYGQTVAWDRFEQIRQQHGVWLIEDAAQAFGAAWHGRKAGSLGDAAAFSFYPTKNLGAAGDGGMVTTGSREIAERVEALRVHGMRRRYVHDEVGWNCRLDALQAAILRVKLDFLDEWNAQRRQIAATYQALFDRAGLVDPGPYPQHGVVLPKTTPGATHIYHQYVIRVGRRDELKVFLRERGIASEVYYPLPLHLQPSLRSLGYGEGSFPESERAAHEVLALPMFAQLTREEQEIVVGGIADFLS